MKDATHEEPLIHLSIWIRNDTVVNEEDDEAKDSSYSCKDIRINKEPTHQTNKDKCSIVISYISTYLNDIIWLCTCLYSVDVFCMSECFNLLAVYYWFTCVR